MKDCDMGSMNMGSMKKMAKIEKLKELRRLMQKQMLANMGDEEEEDVGAEDMLASALGDAEEEDSAAEDMPMISEDIKEDMKEFFGRSEKLPMPKGKTKIMMVTANLKKPMSSKRA